MSVPPIKPSLTNSVPVERGPDPTPPLAAMQLPQLPNRSQEPSVGLPETLALKRCGSADSVGSTNTDELRMAPHPTKKVYPPGAPHGDAPVLNLHQIPPSQIGGVTITGQVRAFLSSGHQNAGKKKMEPLRPGK